MTKRNNVIIIILYNSSDDDDDDGNDDDDNNNSIPFQQLGIFSLENHQLIGWVFFHSGLLLSDPGGIGCTRQGAEHIFCGPRKF